MRPPEGRGPQPSSLQLQPPLPRGFREPPHSSAQGIMPPSHLEGQGIHQHKRIPCLPPTWKARAMASLRSDVKVPRRVGVDAMLA